MHVEVLVPDDYMGDVIGDLNKKRGRVLGMEPVDGQQKVIAEVPSRNVQICYRFKVNYSGKRKL